MLVPAGLAGALVATVLLVGTAHVSAQGPGGGRPGMGRGHFGPGGFGAFNPRGLGLEGANLTDAQRDQVRAVINGHRDELRCVAMFDSGLPNQLHHGHAGLPGHRLLRRRHLHRQEREWLGVQRRQ